MKTFFFLIGILSAIGCHAQYYTPTANSVHFQNRSYGFITELPPAPPDTKGSSYLYENWKRADIFLTDSTALLDVPVKLDVKENRIEIEHQQQVKVLPFRNVIQVSFIDNAQREVHVGARYLSYPGAGFVGLFKIILEGEVLLVSTVLSEVKSANYNAALDVGNRDNEILLKKKYFIVKGKDWIEVEQNKKRLAARVKDVFGDNPDLNMKQVNVKKEEDLILLVKALSES